MSDLDQDQVEIEVQFVEATTDRACLCRVDGEKYWIPWSLIDDGSEIEKMGDSGVAWIPEWFARKEGIPW